MHTHFDQIPDLNLIRIPLKRILDKRNGVNVINKLRRLCVLDPEVQSLILRMVVTWTRVEW